MAGIYIHIPFCKKACHYCDFHFSTSLKFKKEVVDAICKEIYLRKSYLNSQIIETIYFGGGTPSILSESEMHQIMKAIYDNFDVSLESEITIEANPDDLTEEKLLQFKKIGFNRLSIGVQSFFDSHLVWMNRAHSAKESEACIRLAKSVGFENITIDLIYGIPQMKDEEWVFNINKALELEVPHISAYNLTIEENTALHFQIKKGISKNVNDEQGAIHFGVLKNMLAQENYIHYEISNFGKESYFSKHNSAYWKGVYYIGVGPSAHSFDGNSRSWNIANNKTYLDKIQQNILPQKVEVLSKYDLANEHIMIGLRNMWGCDFNFLQQVLSVDEFAELNVQINRLVSNKLIVIEKQRFKTTSKGLMYADQISSDLFLV